MICSDQKQLISALSKNGDEVLAGKGGFWIKGKGFITTAQARKTTGIKSKETRKPQQIISAGGEWAWVAAFNKAL